MSKARPKTSSSLGGSRGASPADIPAYTVSEAAALIGVPVSTLQKWTKGRPYRTKSGPQTSAAIIVTPDPRFLSFTNIVEAHVLASLRKERIALEKIRAAVHFVERSLKVKHALARQEFKTDGVDLFLDQLEILVNASRGGQIGLKVVLQEHLKRVDYDHGRAVRLFPLHRERAPRAIVIDPRRAFGRPVLHGTSVPIADISMRFRRGDRIEQLAGDYDVTPAEIEEALRATHEAA